jgi:tetratricopeptide (TPR) repeat protein
MAYFQSTYHSRIYRDFKAIEGNAYHLIIRFYEDREEAIKQLDYEEFNELLIAYVNALFETGAYRKHLLMVEVVIQQLIILSDYDFGSMARFQRMLFKKAASHYNLMELDRAEYVLRELIRIDPDDRDAAQFLKKCRKLCRPLFIFKMRAICVALFLMAAALIAAEVLLIRPFFSHHTAPVQMTWMALLGAGCALLLGVEIFHRWKVDREVENFVKEAWRRKRRSRISV